MNRISISQAWSYATSFFAGQGANHAIILIGVGIVAPLILQFAPDWLKTLLSSGIAAGGITAIVLNLVFPPEKY